MITSLFVIGQQDGIKNLNGADCSFLACAMILSPPYMAQQKDQDTAGKVLQGAGEGEAGRYADASDEGLRKWSSGCR